MAAEAPSPRARDPSLRWGLWRRPATRGEGRWEPLREGKQRRGMKGRAVLAEREGGRESGKVGQSHRPHWAGHAPSPARRPAPTGPSGPSLLQAWGHSKRQVWEPMGRWREGDRQENTALPSAGGKQRGWSIAGRRGRVPSPGGSPSTTGSGRHRALAFAESRAGQGEECAGLCGSRAALGPPARLPKLVVVFQQRVRLRATAERQQGPGRPRPPVPAPAHLPERSRTCSWPQCLNFGGTALGNSSHGLVTSHPRCKGTWGGPPREAGGQKRDPCPGLDPGLLQVVAHPPASAAPRKAAGRS